jgi:eukaryotic-like serine/threonine-protein kinase
MEISAETDRLVMSIVAVALRQEPAERDAYVRRACQSDAELYREVSEMVSAEERMGSFLQHPMLVFREFPRPFAPGQVIAQRFEIAREIGQGGMGVVYEAFDRKRGLRIAIKAAKPGFQRLLSPELEGALTVRHPNVCRANEIHTAQTDRGEIDFLTLELLEGETLLSRLHAAGKLAHTQALEIARQLCAGLAEAHRSGVIHRDLKSANILLCSDSNGKQRAVITDFGLAGNPAACDGFGGTPDYMAPELWRGQLASKASDIYSLGVILYEMVAGRRPFADRADDRVATRPAPPSTYVRGLPARWDRTILRCLDPSPPARPADAAQVLAGLEKRKRLHRAAPLLGLPVLLLATLLSPEIREWIWRSPTVRLAVLPAVTPEETADMAGALLQGVAERVGHMRSGRRTVAVIPPLEARDMQVQTAQQAKQALHATHALETTVRREGADFVTRVSVVDLETRVRLDDFSARYTNATVGMAPAALASEVSLALRLQGPRVPEAISPAAVQPYDHGLYLLRKDPDSYREAIELFQQAAQADAHSPLPWAALAEAQIGKFKATKQHDALVEAQASLHTAESLNPDSVQVHLVAGLLHKTLGQYDRALDDYRRVQELEPRNVDALLRIAGVYDALDEPAKAIEHYQKAVALQPGYYDPYQKWGAFYYYRGNYADAVEQFRKAIERAPGLYDAYTSLGAALNYLGRDTEAEEALLSSVRLKETPRALNSLGALQAYRGQDAQAASYYERAVRMNPRNSVYLLNLGDAYRRSGRSADAHRAYRMGMDVTLAELTEDPRGGLTRAFVAYFAARLGDTSRAEEEMAQALGLSPGDSMVLRKAVLTYVALGETDRALQILRAAPAEVLRELNRHPDLAEFRRDVRFQQLVASTGGK